MTYGKARPMTQQEAAELVFRSAVRTLLRMNVDAQTIRAGFEHAAEHEYRGQREEGNIDDRI